MPTTIQLEKETKNKLTQIKMQEDVNTYEEVLKILIGKYKEGTK